MDMVTQLLESHCRYGEALVLLADPQLYNLGPSENNWPWSPLVSSLQSTGEEAG